MANALFDVTLLPGKPRTPPDKDDAKSRRTDACTVPLQVSQWFRSQSGRPDVEGNRWKEQKKATMNQSDGKLCKHGHLQR